MIKLLGAILISASGFAFCGGHIHNRRRQLSQLADMMEALGQIEMEIRWKNTQLPRAIVLQTERKYTGDLFLLLLHRLKGGNTLQESWEKVFADFQPGQAAEILCGIGFSGDAQEIMQSLRYAKERLLELYRQMRQEQKDYEKVCWASSFSAAAFLVILLI